MHTQPGWVRRLLRSHGGRGYAFSDVPINVQKSLRQREGEALDEMIDARTSQLRPSTLVGYARLPMTVLKQAVFAQVSAEDPDAYADFEKYHRWYLRHAPVKHHKQVWAVIADPGSDEIITDGWHRFHDYVRSGVTVVPVAWFGRL